MRYLPLLFLSLLCTCVCAQTSPAYQELAKIAHIEQKHMVEMRDGIRLATDIYRPKTDKKVPIILSRTPYQTNGWVDGEERTRTYQRALEWVKAGYAYVVQNERGRYFSEGDWDILGVPLTDGNDAFTWLADRPWSNGNIGLYGCSSTAEWQMAVASLGHPPGCTPYSTIRCDHDYQKVLPAKTCCGFSGFTIWRQNILAYPGRKAWPPYRSPM